MIKRIKFFFKHYIYRQWYNKYVILDYFKKRKEIQRYGKQYACSTLVETGTFLGDTVDFLINDFDKIISIELQPDLAKKAIDRFKNEKHVEILQGDSGSLFPELIHKLNNKTLFWLDGHYSSEFQLGDLFIKTAKGESFTPILKELDAILADGWKNNVILIDDLRCFDGTNDYPKLKVLKKYLSQKIVAPYKLELKNDIIRITPVIQ